MGKNKKTPSLITIDDVEYTFEDMTKKKKTLVNHISDLDKKIANRILIYIFQQRLS